MTLLETLAEIVAREKKNWVTCRKCNVTMHGVYFGNHPCGGKPASPVAEERPEHPDVIESENK